MKRFLVPVVLVYSMVLCPVMGLAAQEGSKPVFRVPVLCYHAVSPVAAGRFAVTPEVFSMHMEYLKKNGHTVISVAGLVSFLKAVQKGEKVSLPEKPVVITFDDNYESIQKHALPVLTKYKYPACNFIYLDGISVAGWERYKRLEGSLMELHSHTVNHVDLAKKKQDEDDKSWRKRIFREIADSRRIIGERLGRSPAFIAYPYGTWNVSVIRMMRIAGYSAGFSAFGGYVRETSSLDVLPRFTIFREYDLQKFAEIVSGAWVGGQGEPDFISARDYNFRIE
ncbi:MAG TPA: polysaccharide deacetylase family protein [Spirochaetota bacterium]|nr:polysaccharide deacetylase family protein [Spirochaetota bacterium]